MELKRLGFALVLMTACGRVAEVCPERQPSGAALVRAADVVVVATVLGGEVEVHSVLEGRLRGMGDRGRIPVEGLPDGLAVVPLRLVDGRYRAVVGCWTPVIPLAWRPAAGLGLRELLTAPAPDGVAGPITPLAAEIAAELGGL
jgi:hypothetical protein